MIEQISIAIFEDWVKQQPQKIVILDVRTEDEFALAKISSQQLQQLNVELVHIPMHQVPERLDELDEDWSIVCLCHHGARSQSVAEFLLERDFEQLANIIGGIDAWSRQLDNKIPRYTTT